MNMAERHAKSRVLWRKHYANVPTRESLLDDAVSAVLRPDHVLLDAGCGDTLAMLNQYSAKAAFAVGADLVAPAEKPVHAAVVTADLALLPFQDRTFDVIVSRSVFEHLREPTAVFAELSRVLKSRGKLIFTTPNKYYYSSVIAGMVPFSLKDFYMSHVFGETTYDHFPVFYRANTRRAFRRIAAATGLRLTSVKAIRHFPYYFLFSPTLFRLGMLYDWVVTALGLDGLQSNWLVEMQRI